MPWKLENEGFGQELLIWWKAFDMVIEISVDNLNKGTEMATLFPIGKDRIYKADSDFDLITK